MFKVKISILIVCLDGVQRQGALSRRSRTVEGDQLDLILRSNGPIAPQIAPRWVYVMAIDCAGRGVLLYPRSGVENKYPREGANNDEIAILGRGYLKVAPPFGMDTYILLTTDAQLPDPSALDFEGVLTKGGTRGSSPLQNLLGGASKGTRGVTSELPTQWSAQTVHLMSTPKTATTNAPNPN